MRTIPISVLVALCAARSGSGAQLSGPDEGKADLKELLRCAEEVLEHIGTRSGEGSFFDEVNAFLDGARVSPQIGGVVSGSGIGLGLTHTLFHGGASTLGWNGLLTSEGYKEVGLFHLQELKGPGRLTWRNRVRYRDLTQEDFFGLGLASARENRSDYRLKETMASSELGFRFSPSLGLYAGGDVRRLRATDGTRTDLPAPDRIFPIDTLPGFGGTFEYASLGAGFTWDTRDRRGLPRRGSFVLGEARQFLGLDGDSPAYRRFVLEVQKAIPLPGYDHAVVARARGDFLGHGGDAVLPFFLSRGLGGSHSLRSFPLNRFRGEDLLLGSVEYRFALVSEKLDGVLFWDFGGAYGTPGKIGLDRLRHSVGAGIRLLRKDDVLLRLEIAHGAEGARILLSFSKPF